MTAPDLRQPVQPITEAALEAAFARLVGTEPGAAEKVYLTQAYEDYAADETPELDGEDLAAHARRFVHDGLRNAQALTGARG